MADHPAHRWVSIGHSSEGVEGGDWAAGWLEIEFEVHQFEAEWGDAEWVSAPLLQTIGVGRPVLPCHSVGPQKVRKNRMECCLRFQRIRFQNFISAALNVSEKGLWKQRRKHPLGVTEISHRRGNVRRKSHRQLWQNSAGHLLGRVHGRFPFRQKQGILLCEDSGGVRLWIAQSA